MITISYENGGTEIVAVDFSAQKYCIAIPSLGLFIFLLLCSLSIFSSYFTEGKGGLLVMGIVALLGDALVGVLVFSCFAKDELHFDAEGVCTFSRWFVRAHIRRIPFDQIEDIRIGYEAGDDDTAQGYHLLIEAADKKSSIRYACEATEESLKELKSVLTKKWHAQKSKSMQQRIRANMYI